MKIFAGTLNDSYTDEEGNEVPYSDKVAGFWRGNTFYCATLDAENNDISTMEISKVDFENKVTEVIEI